MIHLKNFTVDNLYKDVNLNVEENKVTCVTGENGSGKTVFTKYLLGLYKDYSGQILIKNSDNEYEEMNDENYESLRHSIKVIVNNPYDQFVGETVKDEITFKLEQNNVDDKTISEILKNNFKSFDLDQKLSTLNTSRAQELLILSNLTLKEKVLIIDEALSNTSHDFKKRIFKLLSDLNITVLLITNNLDDTYYADVVYKIENNKISSSTKTEQLPLITHNNIINDQVIECVPIIDVPKVSFNTGLNVISGESGSGKTRLIKSVVELENKIFNVRHNFNFIGYVSQKPIEQITRTIVYDQISNKEVSEKQIIEKMREFNLPEKILKRDISTLSTGQLVQVMIIQNILRGTQCIILDEVLEVIDVDKRVFIINYLIEHVECIICSTHNLSIFNEYSYNLVDLEDYDEK